MEAPPDVYKRQLLICGCKSIDAKGDVIQISVEKVYKIINEKKDYFILDVRTKEEFDSGHLESAMLIPLDELESLSLIHI